MNTFQTINTEYLRASRTIETVLVSKGSLSRIFFVYNYEGYSFRVFEDHLNLLHFFQNKWESDLHFSSEIEVDGFFCNVKLVA